MTCLDLHWVQCRCMGLMSHGCEHWVQCRCTGSMSHRCDSRMGGHIVLCIQPNFSSNFIGGCRASLVIIVLCHLVCGMLESSFHLVLHLRHSLGKVICSLYSRALGVRVCANGWSPTELY